MNTLKRRRCRLCGDWFLTDDPDWHTCGCEDGEADLTTTRARPNPAPPPEPAQEEGKP